MQEPVATRPNWPDAIQDSSDTTDALKPWSWALDRLQKSHNYWFSTSRPDGLPHLMLVWGIWWQDSFWFNTGPRTRKAKNLAVNSRCVIGTEDAAEAVILEGTAHEIADRAVWKTFSEIYNRKYSGNIEKILEAGPGNVYRVEPRRAFGQDEYAENFVDSVTLWRFPTG